MSLGNNEDIGKYGLNPLDLASETKKLSMDDHAAVSPALSQITVSSTASSESQAPSFTESSPPSEKSAKLNGSSKSTSRGSSADEHTPASQTFSVHAIDDAIISPAEVNGHTFEYHKIGPALVPEGWSNDPNDLEPFDPNLPSDEYNLAGYALPIVASKEGEDASRYLFCVLGHFYLWVPASGELLYVTQTYRLRGVLQRIHKNSFGLRTRPLESLSHWYSQHQITHPPIRSEEIPSGWSQKMKNIREIDDLLNVHERGLPLPVLILASKCELLMRCGDRYCIYHDIWCNLIRVEEPNDLSEILRALGDRNRGGMRLTECDPLPEFGGPYYVADEEVPLGWSNRVDQDLCRTEIFDRPGIPVSRLLLSREDDRGTPALYLVKGYSPIRYLIWDTVSTDVSEIEQPKTLQDILDALRGSLDELTLSKI